MKRTQRNKRTSRRRNGNTSRPSEGLGRRSSVIISNRLEVPSGVSGAVFSVEELLRKYFQEDRLVKIYGLRIKLQPLNINTPYYQVQSLVCLDQPATPLVALTHVVQGGIYSKRMNITIAQPRRFWVLDKSDDKFLDLRFQTFASVELMCEIETYFHIEIDELTPLSLKTLTLHDTYDDSEDGDYRSDILVVNERPPTTSTKTMIKREIESLSRKK